MRTRPRVPVPRSSRTDDIVPVPILMYHDVGAATSRDPRYTVSAAAFEAQLHYLARRGYQSVALDRFAEAATVGAALPARPVILTFDDGFAQCARVVPPLLEAYGFAGVFFLVAGRIGGTSAWLAPQGAARPMADWSSVRELVRLGYTCGSHTMTHPALARLDRAGVRAELVGSKAVLEDRLGCEVAHLAYPYGSFDSQVRATAAEAGYRTAVTSRPAISHPGDDLLALARVEVAGTDTLLDFASRLESAFSLRGRLLRGALTANQVEWIRSRRKVHPSTLELHT